MRQSLSATRDQDGSGGETKEAQIVALIDAHKYDEATTLIVRTYSDHVYSFCITMLKNAALAADATQQTLIGAHEALAKYRKTAPVSGWLMGIARHRCLDAIKSHQRQQRHISHDLDLPEVRSTAPAPDEDLAMRERSAQVAACLDELSPGARALVLLHHHLGWSFEVLGRILRAKPKTIQKQLARAMPALRKSLRAKGVTP